MNTVCVCAYMHGSYVKTLTKGYLLLKKNSSDSCQKGKEVFIEDFCNKGERLNSALNMAGAVKGGGFLMT